MGATTLRFRLRAHALVDHLEDRIAHHYVLIAIARRARQLELPRVELLVDHDHTRPVPGKHFHGVAALSYEYEQCTRARLRLHLLAHQAAQSLIAEPHVDRRKRDVHGQSVRDHVDSPSADTTARNSAASKPASTRIDTRASCTITSARGVARDGTTLANIGASTVVAGAASFTHRYADDAQTPIRSATTRGISPVALTSAINRSRSSAVCRFRMPTSCQTKTSHQQMGFTQRLPISEQRRVAKRDTKSSFIELCQVRKQVRERIILAPHERRKRRQQLMVLEPTQSIAIVHPFSLTCEIWPRTSAIQPFQAQNDLQPAERDDRLSKSKPTASTLKISCDSSRVRSHPPTSCLQN